MLDTVGKKQPAVSSIFISGPCQTIAAGERGGEWPWKLPGDLAGCGKSLPGLLSFRAKRGIPLSFLGRGTKRDSSFR